MNITVYCGSTDVGEESLNKQTAKLGEYIGQNNHTLIYGGHKTGLMGVIANSTLLNGGSVIGIIPNNIKHIVNKIHPALSEYIYTDDLFSRRAKLMELGDVFIALPGGVGTLNEISEILESIRLNLISKKCIIFNMEGFYDNLEKQIEKFYKYGYISEDDYKNFIFVTSFKQLKNYLDRM